MARPARRHPGNVAGPWFVDDACIDCDASRQCAPDLFGEVGGQTVVIRQPETADELARAARAMLVCPTASIGTTGPVPPTEGLWPHELDDGVLLPASGSTSGTPTPRRSPGSGDAPSSIRDRLVAIPVPGHTRGSVAFHLEDRYLFTGDSPATALATTPPPPGCAPPSSASPPACAPPTSRTTPASRRA